MPMDSAIVGKSSKRFRHEIDARWVMAYSAGLADWNPAYFDTAAEKDAAVAVTAHPVFPVCVEWPVILDVRNIEGSDRMTQAEAVRGVHATHDLHIHRPVRSTDELFTRATIIGVEQRKPGAYQMMCLETTDADGIPVATTYQGGLSRDVAVAGGDRWLSEAPTLPDGSATVPVREAHPIPVAAEAAHVYTECARIWNPIHTDKRVALDAGLPDIILHGTATLALAVTRLVNEKLAGDPTRVKRIACRFAAMVLMPSTIRLEIEAQSEAGIWFTVYNAEGAPALKDGFLGV